MLKAGEQAPDFTLPSQEGSVFSLSEHRGGFVVVYFYSRDNTPGCTRQAAGYEALRAEFEACGAVIAGISRDSAASHKKFCERHSLGFYLLSDPETAVMQAYGVWQQKKLYGKVAMGTVRSSFLIDESGMLRLVRYNVKADADAAAVLESLRATIRSRQP